MFRIEISAFRSYTFNSELIQKFRDKYRSYLDRQAIEGTCKGAKISPYGLNHNTVNGSCTCMDDGLIDCFHTVVPPMKSIYNRYVRKQMECDCKGPNLCDCCTCSIAAVEYRDQLTTFITD